MAKCNDCKRTDVKCCTTCARDSYSCAVWHHCGKDCEKYVPRRNTNADRIRSFSDEELAEFLLHSQSRCYCPYAKTDKCIVERGGDCTDVYAKERIKEWLKSEVKE